jgi:hypothetical protein
MADLIHPDESLVPLLMRVATGDLYYHLILAPYTPTKATTLAALLAIAYGPGTQVQPADFTTSGVASNKGTIIAAPIAMPNASGGAWTAYGYFITDSGTTELYGVLEFDTPVAVPNGSSMNITPILGDSSFYPV